MTWTSGLTQNIVGPCEIHIGLTGQAVEDIGEVMNDIAVNFTEQEISQELESGLNRLTAGYDINPTFSIVNLTTDNIAQIEAYQNKDLDIEFRQSAAVFTNPKVFKLTKVKMSINGTIEFGRGKNGAIPVSIKGWGFKPSDLLAVTDAS